MKRISKIMLAGVMFVMGGELQNPKQKLCPTIYGMEYGRVLETVASAYCAWEKYLSLPWNWTVGDSCHTTILKNRQCTKMNWYMTKTCGGFRTYYDPEFPELGRQIVVFKIKDVSQKPDLL